MNKIRNLTLRAFTTLLFLVVGLEKSNSYAIVKPNLSGLVISAGTLSPAFNTGTRDYTCSEIYAVSSVTVTPSVISGSTIQVKINSGSYVRVINDTPSSALSMNIGINIISILTLTGTTTITVTRASPVVNKNGQATTGSDYMDSNGKTGGTSSVNSNGQLIPAGG